MTEPDRLELLQEHVLEGNADGAAAEARQGLREGRAPMELVDGGAIPGIRRAGELWEEGEFFLPELVGAAEAMQAAMEVLRPALNQDAPHEAGRIVIGTIEGDIHDIGKTLVATLLSAHGFQVVDEGCDVPIPRFVERAREVDADLVCASALLTTTMTGQGRLVAAVHQAGIRARVMVGGAPVTRAWAEEIGAAGYAENAVAAVAEARRLLGHAG